MNRLMQIRGSDDQLRATQPSGTRLEIPTVMKFVNKDWKLHCRSRYLLRYARQHEMQDEATNKLSSRLLPILPSYRVLSLRALIGWIYATNARQNYVSSVTSVHFVRCVYAPLSCVSALATNRQPLRMRSPSSSAAAAVAAGFHYVGMHSEGVSCGSACGNADAGISAGRGRYVVISR